MEFASDEHSNAMASVTMCDPLRLQLKNEAPAVLPPAPGAPGTGAEPVPAATPAHNNDATGGTRKRRKNSTEDNTEAPAKKPRKKTLGLIYIDT